MNDDERLEQVIAFLESQLPPPVRQHDTEDASIFTAGDPPELVAQLTPTTVIIAEYAEVWDAVRGSVVRPRRLGSVRWRRLPETALMNALSALIKGGREARLARFRACSICGRRTPPEALGLNDVCPRCHEELPPVVH